MVSELVPFLYREPLRQERWVVIRALGVRNPGALAMKTPGDAMLSTIVTGMDGKRNKMSYEANREPLSSVVIRALGDRVTGAVAMQTPGDAMLSTIVTASDGKRTNQMSYEANTTFLTAARICSKSNQ
ncbi:hypothetical protein DAPPUDRAFT_240707 [Daphnia pulex]|uniref:Uncharacterized protein n=1 Tax=Daphnia pulex TaxID=6669 RepID=E9GCB1_DAPPU|nr:hypothetical protein DAPPUDRAFT_240707 [Daphnia pulex]|eukprot:EFX82519.1 hypothetical protein DAPPUDRAFT_240707 [Daphnia pulex]